MKYTMKKTLAFLLTLVMLVNILPVSVLAEQPDEGRRGPLNVQKSRGVNDNYHTVIITVADDVSWNGHLYFVLKQEQVSTPQGNADQYFVGEIQKPGGTVQATTFKAAYWGASDNLYDNTKHVEAKAAVNNWNVNNTINSESPINSSGDVKYIDSINNAPIRISTDDDNNTTTITIGEITTVPVPHTVSIEMHNNGGPIPQINIKNNAYCVVATVNNVAYYGLISEDGTVGKFYSDAGDQTEDGIIPDIADDGSVKIVEYVNGKTAEALAAKTPLAEIERGGPAGPGGPEYYTVTGPELDETANEYCFTLAEKKECKATLTNTTGIDLLNLYALAKVGDTPVAYADLSNLTRSEKTMLSFTDGTQQIKLYNNTTFEIVYYDGNNLNLANLNASNEKLTINNGIVDDIHFEWNSEPTTPSEPPTPDNPPDRYNIIATLPESTTATLTFDPNTGVTLNGDYYLLVKDSNGNYKYYAPVSDSGLGDFTKTKGTPQANYLVDAASFEFVKAEGTVTGIDDLKELDKIVDGGTIGEYYTVDLPTEAVNGVYAITAEKQENKYYMQYNNAAGGITLAEGSYYYLLATMDGTPVFYTALPTTSGTDPIQFTDGTNTIETLPNVSLSLKQIASAASSLSAFNNIDDAQVITDNEGRKYHISSFEAPHSRSNTNEYNITVDEITAENAVVIDYYNNGQPDTSAANNMTAKYYLEITVDGTSYYAPITIIGSEAVLSEYKKVSDDSSYTIPANKNEIQYSNILKYTGDGELTASYMNEVVNGTKRYYYDPAGLLSTIQVNENTTVDGYDYSFDKIRAEDNNFHITATKRPVYLVKIRTYEQDEETEVTPDFDNGYYIRATINATEGEYKDKPVGWTMVPVTWSGEPVTEVKIQGFVGLNNKPKAFDQNATETALNFDEYYVDLDSIRLCTLKNTDQKPENYNQALNPDDDPNSKIDDAAPDGYKYFDDVSEEEDGSAVIKLKEENQVKYHVRLKFDTLKDSDISVDGGLYVRVTVEHKSGDPTYAYVKVTNDMIRTPDTEHGCTYIDIPIDGESIKWLKADGTPASSQTYTGYEKSTTVELFGVPASVTNPTPGNPGDKLYVDPLRPYYVNKFALTHYPESGEEPDRIKELNKEDGVDYWYDVVELTKDTSKFPSYTLEYILNSYNVVALCDNTEGTDGNPGQGDVNLRVHQMGGVLVRGDLLLGVGGSEGNIPSGIADSRLADKPSVVGGQIIGLTTNGPFVSARGDNYDIVPFYLGSAGNTVIGRIINGSFKGADGQLNNGNLSDPGDPPKATEGVYPNPTEQFRFGLNKAGSTLTSSDYIQWESLQNNILKASDALATDAEYNAAQYAMQHPDATTNPYLLTREDATPKEGKLEFEVTVGDNVIISGIGPDEVIVVRVKGTDECPDPASPTAPGTVINFLEDQNFRIPEIRINNGQSVPTTTENGEGISIVFNYPNCGSDKVIRDCGTTQFGHAVAPKAEIDIVSSNYSGCMVCNNAKIYNEGHMYPYRGDTLVGFHADLKATKLVDGHEPSNKQIYDFKIFSLRSVLTQTQYNNADYWEALPTVNNEGSEVTFKDVSFYAAGKYYFMVYEDTSDLSDKDIPDTRVYLIECEAEKDGKLLKMIEDSIKYYEVLTDDISELVTVTENPAGNGKHFTSIDLTDTDKVAPIGSLSWTSTEDQNGEIETGIEFLNQKLKSGLNIRKEVTGNPTTDPEFTFIVYLWEEIEEDGTVTYSYIDPDENNIVIKKYSNGTETTLDTDFSAQGTYSDGNGEHIANIATLTLKRNESLNINGIIVDTHYAVLEKVNGSNTPLNGNNEVIENYTLISVGDNTNTPEDGVQGVISNDANASVIIQFTNEYTEEKGSLTVKKQITGISGQDSKAYPITIKATVDGATKF
ncbi:T surface-antigen of pili, partial [Aristaeella hokkaidonensis]|uniref:DUF7601 domain-containing protein n=1 Tax=Aristaeella hokkaidonensis TaxID=3046382 RepID=UPI000B641DDE